MQVQHHNPPATNKQFAKIAALPRVDKHLLFSQPVARVGIMCESRNFGKLPERWVLCRTVSADKSSENLKVNPNL